jgi:hypothetical protein
MVTVVVIQGHHVLESTTNVGQGTSQGIKNGPSRLLGVLCVGQGLFKEQASLLRQAMLHLREVVFQRSEIGRRGGCGCRCRQGRVTVSFTTHRLFVAARNFRMVVRFETWSFGGRGTTAMLLLLLLLLLLFLLGIRVTTVAGPHAQICIQNQPMNENHSPSDRLLQSFG